MYIILCVYYVYIMCIFVCVIVFVVIIVEDASLLHRVGEDVHSADINLVEQVKERKEQEMKLREIQTMLLGSSKRSNSNRNNSSSSSRNVRDVVKSVPRLDSKEQFNLEDDSSSSSSDDMGNSNNSRSSSNMRDADVVVRTMGTSSLRDIARNVSLKSGSAHKLPPPKRYTALNENRRRSFHLDHDTHGSGGGGEGSYKEER